MKHLINFQQLLDFEGQGVILMYRAAALNHCAQALSAEGMMSRAFFLLLL